MSKSSRMVIRALALVGICAGLVASAAGQNPPAQGPGGPAQPSILPATAGLPQTYSFTGTVFFPLYPAPLNVRVDREGLKELVDTTGPPIQGKTEESKGFHTHQLYDFQAHKMYTQSSLDSPHTCKVQNYTSSPADSWWDPIAGAAQMSADMAKQNLKPVGAETVNGLATKVFEAPEPDTHGKVKVWISEKYGFPVKQVLVPPSGPPVTFLEIKQLSFAKPAASLLVPPANCQVQEGEASATGGHAEIHGEVKVQARTDLATGKTTAAVTQGPGGGKVTEMVLVVDPAKYTGPCPARLNVAGSITVDGPTKVPYQFHSNLKLPDGKYLSWPGGVLTFPGAGTQSFSKTLDFPEAGPKYSTLPNVGTRIPNPMHSKQVSFSVECGGAAEKKIGAGGGAAAQQKTTAGPFATQAKVEVKSHGAVIPLKREEQIAFMFVEAINSMEDEGSRHADEPCTLDALIRGPKSKGGWPLGKLRFDPNATDPNYSYKVVLDGNRWQVWANPRKPGLGGIYLKGGLFGGTWYNPAGPATEKDKKIDGLGIAGDSFKGR